MNERRMNNIGTNTLDVEVEPDKDRLRTSTVEGNAHTSILIVDVLLPSGHGDHVKIPHVNLSIRGYEPDSLRTLVGTRSPSMRTHEIQEEIAMMMIIEDHIEIEDPLREGDIQTKVGDPLTEEDTLIEDLLEKDIP